MNLLLFKSIQSFIPYLQVTYYLFIISTIQFFKIIQLRQSRRTCVARGMVLSVCNFKIHIFEDSNISLLSTSPLILTYPNPLSSNALYFWYIKKCLRNILHILSCITSHVGDWLTNLHCKNRKWKWS